MLFYKIYELHWNLSSHLSYNISDLLSFSFRDPHVKLGHIFCHISRETLIKQLSPEILLAQADMLDLLAQYFTQRVCHLQHCIRLLVVTYVRRWRGNLPGHTSGFQAP